MYSVLALFEEELNSSNWPWAISNLHCPLLISALQQTEGTYLGCFSKHKERGREVSEESFAVEVSPKEELPGETLLPCDQAVPCMWLAVTEEQETPILTPSSWERGLLEVPTS